MSVEPSESMSEAWTRWQGQVINGVFPLGRCLGSSEHSGVFLTRAPAPGPAEVAIKLVPTNRALAESLLPRWKRAGGLAHPHLLPLLQWGGCQLEGLPYLYALMEYADQTLAQLLLHRALTGEEAREMLLPVVDALAFLHAQDMVQGQLKPANILVVGDQLKLASDTVRRCSEAAVSTHAFTAYDPPEARQGATSPAGDVWALGVTLLEALTRRLPSGLGESGEAVVLPADFPGALREVVARCLSPKPQDRPGVAELAAVARGESAQAVTIELPALAPPEPLAAEPVTPEPVIPVPVTTAAAPSASLPTPVAPADARPAPPVDESPKPRWSLTATLGVLVILALVWGGIRMFGTHRTPAAPRPPAPVPVTGPAAGAGPPVSAGSATQPSRSEAAASPAAVHEVLPDVPLNARRTIRGHIKVWVRVIVNPDGSVFAATPDRAGSSRYFERLALEAAEQWTFPPADAPSQRIMQVRFDFSRDGTTGRAVRLR
jgi:outer membrane biosynthesis protein TonB